MSQPPLPVPAMFHFCHWGDVFCHKAKVASVARRIGTSELCIMKNIAQELTRCSLVSQRIVLASLPLWLMKQSRVVCVISEFYSGLSASSTDVAPNPCGSCRWVTCRMLVALMPQEKCGAVLLIEFFCDFGRVLRGSIWYRIQRSWGVSDTVWCMTMRPALWIAVTMRRKIKVPVTHVSQDLTAG